MQRTKRIIVTMLAAFICFSGLADLPQPYIHWKMDAITGGKIANAGTNTDARCALTVADELYVTNIQGVANALYFDAVRFTNVWAKSWTPGVRSRTFSCWLWREPTNGEMDTTVNKNHYLIQDLSFQNVMFGPTSLDIAVKLGVLESTAAQIAHSYFYAVLKPPRGTWHHIAVTFEDTGLVETAEEGYVGCPIYNMRAYIDGALYKEVLGRTLERDPYREGSFTFGNASSSNGTRPIYGAVAEVRFYDCALSADDVRDQFLSDSQARPAQLAGYYPMDEITLNGEGKRVTPDRSGNGGNPMLLGDTAVAADGVFGNGLELDGHTGAWGSVAGNRVFTDATVAFWVRVATNIYDSSAWGNTMVRFYSWYNTTRLMLADASFSSVPSQDGTVFLYGDTVTTLPRLLDEKGQWSHVAVSSEIRYNTSEARYEAQPTVYVNGRLHTAGGWTPGNGAGWITPVNTSFLLGNSGSGGSRAMMGRYDDLRIFSGALDAQDVWRIYRGPAVADAGPDFTVATSVAVLRGAAAATNTAADVVKAAYTGPVLWSLVTAPTGGGGASIETPAGLSTRVMLPAEGTYVFRLTAGEARLGLAATDEVSVTRVAASSGNHAPSVSLAASAACALGDPLALAAVVADSDSGPGTLRVTWKKISGPGGVWFEPAHAAAAVASFSAPGEYVIRCVADDGQDTGSTDVTVTVSGTAFDHSSLTNGLLRYWPMEVARADTVSNTIGQTDGLPDTYVPGIDGRGYRGRGKTSSFITGCTLGETGTEGWRPQAEEGGTVWRTFSFWMYHDAASPGTNDIKSVCLLSVPYTLGFWYAPEDGIAGNNKLFTIYHQSMGYDENGNNLPGSGGMMYYGSPPVSPENRWMHVYVAFDRYNVNSTNETQLWIDGVKQTPASGIVGFARVKSTVQLTLGGMNANRVGDSTQNGYYRDNEGNVLSRTLPGVMDDVRMYNRLLSEAEIKYLASHPVLTANRGPSVDALAETDTVRVSRQTPRAFSPTAAGEVLPYDTELTYLWSCSGGDASAVTFADAAARATTVTFAHAGTYVVQLAVSDGERTTYSDPLTIMVPEKGTVISLR